MHELLRVGWAFGWRMAASFGGFQVAWFAGAVLERLRGRPSGLPVSWVLSLNYSLYTFGLLARGLAAWTALALRGRRGAAVARVGLAYTLAALVLCGAWTGSVDRPYRLLLLIGCGWLGLATPWVVECILARLAQRQVHVESIIPRSSE